MGYPVYQCFLWQGERAALSSVEARCDPGSDLPPVSVRNWTSKPGHLCKAIYCDVDKSLAWMWTQLRSTAAYMHEHFPQHVPDIETQFRTARRQLDHDDMACQWGIDLPTGICVVVAIVSVWDDATPAATAYVRHDQSDRAEPGPAA